MVIEKVEVFYLFIYLFILAADLVGGPKKLNNSVRARESAFFAEIVRAQFLMKNQIPLKLEQNYPKWVQK